LVAGRGAGEKEQEERRRDDVKEREKRYKRVACAGGDGRRGRVAQLACKARVPRAESVKRKEKRAHAEREKERKKDTHTHTEREREREQDWQDARTDELGTRDETRLGVRRAVLEGSFGKGRRKTVQSKCG